MVIGLGKKLKSARERYGYTQEEIATNAGVSKNHLSAIENDRRGVTTKTLNKILEHIGCSMSDVMGTATIEAEDMPLYEMMVKIKQLPESSKYRIFAVVAEESEKYIKQN